MRLIAGVDGGGTRSTIALADAAGRELLRRTGPGGLIDPRDPTGAAETVAALLRDALAEIGAVAPVDVLCAGLAGAGSVGEREMVRDALIASGAARAVRVVSDGAIALEGALGTEPGILLLAGTGSVAYGRGENGRVERCGGWGWVMGDEGSAVSLARAALRAALRCEDGRGPATQLLPRILAELNLSSPAALPGWAGRAAKREVAALAPLVTELAAADDWVAVGIVEDAAGEIALHAAALARRLAPWSEERSIVFHGGLFRSELFTDHVGSAVRAHAPGFAIRRAKTDAVTGALRLAGEFP